KCVTATETILWDPSELADQCPYRTTGNVTAQLSERFATTCSMQAVFVRVNVRRAEVMKKGVIIEFSLEEQPSRDESNRVLSGTMLFVGQLPEQINNKSDASVNARL
ncbi:hypothetical protein Tcan_01302, partial [Toxocara canis]